MSAVVLANGMIALAYFVISAGMTLRALERKPVMRQWFFWSFAVFIFSCGVSHVLDDVTLWFPIYWWQALELGFTAFVSLIAAMLPVSLWLAREASNRQRITEILTSSGHHVSLTMATPGHLAHKLEP